MLKNLLIANIVINKGEGEVCVFKIFPRKTKFWTKFEKRGERGRQYRCGVFTKQGRRNSLLTMGYAENLRLQCKMKARNEDKR